MKHDAKTTLMSKLGSLAVSDLLPERPTLIGEFSPAYDAFSKATLSDLSPVTQYEYVIALQLVDLNWAILQAKASADSELSDATEKAVRHAVGSALEREGERQYNRLRREFLDGGGDEDDFEDPVDWEAIDARVEAIVAGLKSKDFKEREAATLDAIDLGVDPRLVLSAQLLNNSGYRRHSERLPDLEKRARLLSAEYREVQKARPIDIVPAAEG